MNRDEIIRMAQEAGNMRIDDYYTNGAVTAFSDEQLKRFAALVAETERRYCVDDCNAEAAAEGTAQRIIQRIRARGQA